MPKLQKVSEKVFAEIAETPQKKGAYTTFLDIDRILGLEESKSLKQLKEMYFDILEDSKDAISNLAAIEEIIIQIRCKNIISQELRLSLSRNYIYARSIFYRRGNQINDIRVIVGSTDEWGTNLDVLLEKVKLGEEDIFVNKGFTDMCIEKLSTAMDKEINKNLSVLKTLVKQ